MQTITYATGRTYNGPQVLTITHMGSVKVYELEDMFQDIDVLFEDKSRHIKGTVRLMAACLLSSSGSIGRDVLDMYDNGLYTLA